MGKKSANDVQPLSERIKWALERSGYESIAEFARELGLSPSAVHQWSDGSTEFIRPMWLFRAARLLRVEAEWLGSGEGHRTRLERGVDGVDAEICRLIDALPQKAKEPLLALLTALRR